MKSLRVISLAMCLMLGASVVLAQDGLGKGKSSGSSSQGSGSSKSQGKGQEKGSGKSQGGMLDRGQSKGQGRSQGSRDSGGSNDRWNQSKGSRDQGKSSGSDILRGRSQGGGSTTRDRQDPPLGRIDRGSQDRGSSQNRGGINERWSQGKGDRQNYNLRLEGGQTEAFRIDRAPKISRGGSLRDQVLREDNPRVRNGMLYGGSGSGLRFGYFHYSSGWNDDQFGFGWYAGSPYGQRCSVSPWYYYPHFPGYILIERIVYVNGSRCDFNSGRDYHWSRGNWGDRYDEWGNNFSDRELDRAIDDLVDAFEQSDRRALGRLVSRSQQVGVYMDGNYCYSLRPDDFYQLMLDNVSGTHTTNYRVESVRSDRDGARVSAVHEYIDPWGGYTSVRHYYRLKQDRYGYYIADFQTSGR